MCGINGLIQTGGDHNKKMNAIQLMNEALTHRGPDSEGQWSFEEKLYFGHRRLSIIELSELGHQPMLSASGNSAIVLNGEIYNFSELRSRLSLTTKGNSDTEVLVEYIEQFGIESTLKDIRGMFAFAYFDLKRNELILARDPFGEKPLYFGRVSDTFYFSSELKPIAKACGGNLSIDNESVVQYLKYNYIPSPKSIYKEIQKLPAGHSITITLNGQLNTPKPYFSKKKSSTIKFSEKEAFAEVRRLLTQAVKRQMVSDVPLGVFLSSGVDSSLIAALMQESTQKKIRSFTIGFDIEDYDESSQAKAIAEHLGLDHTEYICSSNDLLDQVPRLANIYDEPFSDSSQIPTLMLSQMTKQHVTVALSGDGGDEVFAGYNRYLWLQQAHSKLRYIPKQLYKILELVPLPYVANKVDKLRHISAARNLSEAFELVLQNSHSNAIHSEYNPLSKSAKIYDVDDMMIQDQNRYLPDDILVKVDRASMSTSLETRAPYLDVDLYDFVSRLPTEYKIKNGQTKIPLRRTLQELVPEQLTRAPKKGFAVPIDSWLRNELKDWASDLLSEAQLKRQDFINPEVAQLYLQEHLSGKRNRQFELWNLLVFQSWLERWR